jgi:hypothetical protein
METLNTDLLFPYSVETEPLPPGEQAKLSRGLLLIVTNSISLPAARIPDMLRTLGSGLQSVL